MRKQSKAREKAFDAAAAHMATRDTYQTPEDYGWHLIWDAARTWTVKNWRAKVVDLETHLIAARHNVGEVHSLLARTEENLKQVTETAANRLREINSLKSEADRMSRIRSETIQTQAKKITELRLELDRIKTESVEIATRHQQQLEQAGATYTRGALADALKRHAEAVGDRNEALNKIMRLEASVLDQKVMIRNLRQEIATLRPLTTSGAKEAYQNVERLARELAATKDALILAEDEGRDLREKLSQAQDVSDARQSALEELTERTLRCTAMKTEAPHLHKCLLSTSSAMHACSCGHRWYS